MANKNLGPFNYFTTDWFRQHQRPLLYLLNNPMTKLLARYLLRVRSCDIPFHEPVLRLMPNGFLWGLKLINGKPQLRFDLRCHHKYAKRLYYAGKPLWSLMHAFDMKVANPFIPAWNLGFDDWPGQPYYPDPNPETSTFDCCYNQHDTDWATTRGAATGAFDDTSQYDYCVRGDLGSSPNYYIFRGIFLFNLAALSGTITAATLSTYGRVVADLETTNPADLLIVQSNPASNTGGTDTDYAALGTTAFSNVTDIGSFSTSGYNAVALISAGLTYLTSVVGSIAKLGTRGNNDLDNSHAPTSGLNQYSRYQCYASDYTGTTRDPKLTGTYTPAAPSTYGGMMF